MNNLNTDITNRVRRQIVSAKIAALAIAALLPGCAGPQLSPESASSPASVKAPETPPQIATVSLNDQTTSSITARLKEAGASQPRTDHPPAHSAHPSPTPASKSESENAMYTCPMHPEIKQAQPGECSICGMNLVPI